MMHGTTYEYLKPTERQLADMAVARRAFADLSGVLAGVLPPGPDATYVIRKLRECAMWTNVAITRHPDGSPRHEELEPKDTQ
jgi:hypothetical protein